MKATLFKLLTLIVVVSMSFSAAGAQSIPEGEASTVPDTKLHFSPVTGKKITIQSIGKSETGLYIIRLKDPALASYTGGILNLAPTAPEKTGVEKLDVNTPASIKYSDYLELQQGKLVDAIEKNLSRSVQVKYSYKNVLNAIAVEMSKEEAETVAALPVVVAIHPDQIRQLDTEVSVDLIGAPAVWDGFTGTGLGTKGEGIIVGMIDSGINHAHPSFADIGGDGYDHTNPKSGYLGVCDPAHPNYIPNFCNDKLIGAYNFYPGITSPEDVDGHGSHTASTAAGNIHDATIDVGTSTFNLTLQGVAPHANLIAYKVCHPSCPSSSSVAAVDQAIADGVDVLNYSISGSDDPWNDPVDLAFLDAFNAGIFVSASAGNDGPDPSTAAKTGGWNASVGNSTTSRIIANTLDVISPEHPLSLEGMAALQGTGPALSADIQAEIIAFENSNLTGCVAFTAGFFTGKIALIQRGGCNFSVKVANAEAAGAVAVIVFNNAGGPPFVMGELEDTTIPSAMLDKVDGDALYLFVSNNPGTVARFNTSASYMVRPEWQDVMNSSSSRGPSQFETIKPDYVAPGTNILAAVSAISGDPAQYDFYSGTSMAAPHGAGSAALLIALHPDWSPAEVKSALASTAYDENILNHDGNTEAGFFDRGSGRLSLADAAFTGLVMDETHANFVAANPDEGGDPKTLNLPNFADYVCLETCAWTRTVKSVLPISASYNAAVEGSLSALVTVEPSSFTLAPGASQELVITVDATTLPVGTFSFGSLVLSTDAEITPAPHLILTQGFDTGSFPPSGWTSYNLDGLNPEWDSTPSQAHTGVKSAVHIKGSQVQDGWLVSPAFSPKGDTVLSFWELTTEHKESLITSLMVCTSNCSNPPANWSEVTVFSNPSTTWREQTADLSTYVNQDIQLAFRYQGSQAGNWYIDDIAITNIPEPTPVPDQHFPMVVVSSTGTAPEEAVIETRRNAGSIEVDGFLALEITELTSRTYGMVKAEQLEEYLEEDPTNSNPYDAGGTFFKTFTVSSGDKRLIAEIIDTTSPDLDLFMGRDTNSDGLPQEVEEVCVSATATAFEKCDLLDPTAGTWWVLVQNWEASAAALDLVVLASSVVPRESAENMWIVGETAIPKKTPFGVQVFWDIPEMVAGDIYYGAFDLGTDATHPGNVGTTKVNLYRHDDDVTKTVSQSTATVGETLTYTITVQPNVTGKDLTYTITDTIPTGLTYVPGTATNGATVVGNELTWEGVMNGESSYQVSTSAEDPACSVPLANSGNYTDLELFEITVNSELVGDTTAEGLLFPGNPFNFYGIDQTTALYYGDDGFAFFDPDNFAGSVWENQAIPDINVPNGLIAAFWNDWEIVLDPVTNKGVTVASLGDPTIAALIEYDDIIPFGGDGSEHIDFEMFMWKDVSDVPGDYEIYFAYDNIVGDFTTGTIGAESPDGTEATVAAYNDSVLTSLSNGSAICLDWVAPTSPVEISYQVTVDEQPGGTVLTNEALHNTDNAGSKEESVSVEVTVMANTTPVLNEIGDREVDELVLLAFTATATDADDDDLTFEIEGLPTGASFGEDNGEFTWTPAEDQDGIYPITITVSDGDKEDSESFTITVHEVNQAPVLTDIFDKVGNVGDPLTFTAVATDPDVPLNTLSYSLEGAPASAAIDSLTGVFTWTPTLPDVYTFDVVVNDGTGTSNATDKETISVTVGPLLYAIGDKVVDEGEELTFTATAGGSGVYTFAIEDMPAGASFNTETGAFAWTPGESNGGLAYDVTINVSDGTTIDSEIVTITVNETNVLPVLAPIGDKQVTLGNSVGFTASATDDDLPVNTLTYSLNGAPGDAAIGADTGDFYWIPDTVGDYTFMVVVSDGEGGTDEEEITITVIDQEPVVYYLYLPLISK